MTQYYTYQIFRRFSAGSKLCCVPSQYYPFNREEKVSRLKTKIIKLEAINQQKQNSLERILAEVGPIDLSESEIDELQDLVEEMPLLTIAGTDPLPIGQSSECQQPLQPMAATDALPIGQTSECQQPLQVMAATDALQNSPNSESQEEVEPLGLVDELAGQGHPYEQNVSRMKLFVI